MVPLVTVMGMVIFLVDVDTQVLVVVTGIHVVLTVVFVTVVGTVLLIVLVLMAVDHCVVVFVEHS